MADWTNLPNQAVGVGGLPSGTTVTALRDNPIAIAQGAGGAPRVQTAAIQNNAITPAKIPISTVSDRVIGFGVGGVGAFAFLRNVGSTQTFGAGTTRSGSDLRYSNAAGDFSGSPSGTWRLHGAVTGGANEQRASLWERIS